MQHSYDVTVTFKVDLEEEGLMHVRALAAALDKFVQSDEIELLALQLEGAVCRLMMTNLPGPKPVVSAFVRSVESEVTYAGK